MTVTQSEAFLLHRRVNEEYAAGLHRRNNQMSAGYTSFSALVAELVDAQHSGCCARTGVEVQVLSRAQAAFLPHFRPPARNAITGDGQYFNDDLPYESVGWVRRAYD